MQIKNYDSYFINYKNSFLISVKDASKLLNISYFKIFIILKNTEYKNFKVKKINLYIDFKTFCILTFHSNTIISKKIQNDIKSFYLDNILPETNFEVSFHTLVNYWFFSNN